MPSRICGRVIAGVHFFSPSRFRRQEPRRDRRRRLVVPPADPIPHLVVGQARFGLRAWQACFDAVFGLRRASEFGRRSVGVRVRQMEVDLRDRAIAVADHDRHFVVGTLAPLLVASADATLQHFHDRAASVVHSLGRYSRVSTSMCSRDET